MRNLIAALTMSVEPATLMGKVAEQACVFTPKADGAAVSLRTDDYLTVVSTHGVADSLLGNIISIRGTFQAQALETMQPQYTGDAATDFRLPARLRRWAVDSGVRSWVTIPLYRHGFALGALNIMATGSEAFTPLDVAGISSMGRFVSALIDSNSEMRELLSEFLSDATQPDDSPTAQFLASFLTPNLDRADDVTHRVDELLRNSHQFQAVFQPVVDLNTGKILGFEGLCRFPQASAMDTEGWFREARRVGRGIPLELAAAQTVLSAARDIPEEFDVGVNLSPLTACNDEVQALLMSTDRQLVLELTEHERFPADLNDRLEPLRKKGVLVAVDDVGAGFASLTQILRIRPDIIKLDGEFIRGIEHDSVKRALAAAIVQFSTELGAFPVAESIENAEQKEVVQRLGIPRGQGYFIGYPRTTEELFSIPGEWRD